MAEETKSPAGSDKLKEIERNLAKELDQNIVISGDPRVTGQVQLNPTLKTQTGGEKDEAIVNIAQAQAALAATAPMPAVQTNIAAVNPTLSKPLMGKKVDDITLSDVDEILNTLDAGFTTSIAAIKSELGPIDTSDKLES